VVRIRLLGPPTIERDGREVRPPRGGKSWALLSYLLLAERPPSRTHLAELLFTEANDPLGALRWTLAELRRVLGPSVVLTGDPVTVTLGPDVSVDVLILSADLLSAGDLLDGVQLQRCPEFESWLLVARHRISATVEAALHETAVALLASGRAKEAVPYASRAVAGNPLDEGNHELLVRCLAASGDKAAALRQVAVCEDIFRRELGVDPSPALRDAADAGTSAVAEGGRAAALSQLEAGRAAIVAGAVDAGIDCLRRAVDYAARAGESTVHARALGALGSALIHAARGRDEEGAVVLHEAIAVATTAGERETSAMAHRELGYVDVQAGRRSTADAWLAKAQELASTDAELAAVLGVRGMNASDSGDYPSAFTFLAESVERAASGGDARQQAWSLSIVARAHLLRGERSQSTAALGRSLDLIREQRWIAFLPWPQSLRAEVDLIAGDLDGAADGLEQAWVLARQLGDPCWEGMAARGMGLLHARRGDRPAAATWLDNARVICGRVSDRYQWVHGYVLDAAITTALDHDDHDRARPMVDRLATLAARCDMRELVVRAHLHQARLGDPAARGAARLLAADIDNPALADLLR